MKNFIFLYLLFGCSSLLAQYNCMSTKQLSHSHALQSSIDNSAKSDSFNLHHIHLQLDLTAIPQGQLHGEARILFSPRLAGLTRLNLDLLKLSVDSVRFYLGGSPLSNFSYQYNDSLLAIDMLSPLALGDTGELRIFYRGSPQMDASGWGGVHRDQGYYYNLGVGFAANPHTFGRAWFPCFDNFVEKSTYTLEVKSVSPLLPLLNGDSINRVALNGDTVLSTSRLEHPTPSYLISFALANYQFLADTVQGRQGLKNIILAAKAADTSNLRQSFRNLKATFHAFEHYFGPYRWPRVGYAITTVGAMEHATSIHYPLRLADGSLNGEDIMAHELAHHWFGNLITCATADDMWINEGMAEFASHLYEEQVYSRDAYLKTVRENAYRVLTQAHRRDNAYRPLFAPPHEYVYGFHVYQKGAMVGHNLRHYLGDSLFFGSLQQLFSRHAYSNLSTAALRDELVGLTGQNALHDFWENWVYQPGFPQFSVQQWQYDSSKAEAQITLRQRLYQAPQLYDQVPVPVTFWSARGQMHRVLLTHSGQNSNHSAIALPFSPVAALAGYDPLLLTATVWDQQNIVDATPQNGRYSGLDLRVDQFRDSGKVILMQHFVPAEKKASNEFDFKLSSSRYFTVQKLGLGQTDLSLELRFDGSTNGSDQDLLQNGNDSLVVLYRANGSREWNLYPYQQKNSPSANSKVGIISLGQIKNGDYVLANSRESLSLWPWSDTALTNLRLYPNPVEQILSVEVQGQRQLELRMTNAAGQEIYLRQAYQGSGIHRLEIDMSQHAAGVYRLEANGQVYGVLKR